VIFSDKISIEEFIQTTHQLHFLPNNMCQLFYPGKFFIAGSKQMHNQIQDRNEFFKEIREKKLTNKFSRMDNMANYKAKKPLLINYSKVQSDIADYLSAHNKTGLTKWTAVDNMINEYFARDLPKINPGKTNVFFIITEPQDIFLNYLDFGIRKNWEGISKTFADKNIILINPYIKLSYVLSLTDKKKNISMSNMMKKFVKFFVKFDKNTPVDSPDIIIPSTEETLTEEEKAQLPVLESLIPEAEEESLPRFKTEKEAVDINDIKNLKEEIVSYDDTNEANYEPLSDITLDEIADAGISNELDKIKRDNEEFLGRMLKWQEKALSEHEKIADELSKDKTLDSKIISDKTLINESIKQNHLNAISLSYYKKQHLRDMLNTVKSLNNDPEHPVVVSKFSMVNNSNPLNLQHEVSVQFIDKKGKRHTFAVDVPILSHDGYLYYNGTKKFVTKQATLLPIIKEANDRVQITTNYRKSFIYRKGDKINSTIDKVLKLVANKDYASIKKVYGNSKGTNIEFDTSIPYNYIATKFYSIQFDTRMILMLNQKDIRLKISTLGYNVDLNKYTPVGFILNGKAYKDIILEERETKKIVNYSVSGKKVTMPLTDNLTSYLKDIILSSNVKEIADDYNALSSSKSLAYTEIKIASTSLAVGVLIAFYKGLIPALTIYNIKHSVEDKRRRLKDNETLLPFKDIFVYVDTEGDSAKDLFINGLAFLNTREYSIKDADRLGTLYLEYFNQYTGSRNTAKALMNFENSMIDPITLEILKEMKLPETFPELILKGNTMLADYNRKRKNDTSNFRLRGAEVINVAFYNVLMNAYNNYKRTAKTGIVSPIRPNSKQAVMKEIGENPNVEGYSVLNPFYEIDAMSKTSYKGPSGLTKV
jgi:hypothetical protein